ncbi:MAG TPA: DoxX family protein [Candidatus Limnocylindrales bacterium]|nr:DoxX family protein [Candidatus Limnocylindrales bacterium]
MKTDSVSTGGKRRITGNVLMILGGVMLVGSSSAKFAHVPAVVTQLDAMGFAGTRLMFIAVLEIVSAVLFLIPLTRSGGLLLVSSFMGGAIATHLQHGESIVQPSFVLLLIWLGTWLRHPVILQSLNSARQETGSAVPATLDSSNG